MITLNSPIMVVTDLDGSLLDHFDYTWQPAQSWLDRLQQHNIPIVFCTSKTPTEVFKLQKNMNITAPFIAENGAVIYLSPQQKHILGQVKDLTTTVQHIKHAYHFNFTTFSEMTNEQLMKCTNLKQDQADDAKQRDASEPLLWKDTVQNLKLFASILKRQHLKLIQGGRFWHVVSEQSGKDKALAWLLRQYPQHTQTIGLGDAPNDKSFLEKTDYSVVIKTYAPTELRLNKEAYYTQTYGPQGWSEGLQHFIQL